jgi:excisionase family DNA binding protein
MSELITVPEAAEILGLQVSRVYQMCRDGILPPGVAIRFGRQWRVDVDALEEFVRRGGQGLPGGWRRHAAVKSQG